jgi:hypothetical protein
MGMPTLVKWDHGKADHVLRDAVSYRDLEWYGSFHVTLNTKYVASLPGLRIERPY